MSENTNESNWIAEDVPMYMVDTRLRQPMTDEDAGMSAPNRLARNVTYAEACAVVAKHLEEISLLNFVQRDGQTKAYQAASAMFEAAAPTGESRYPMTFGVQVAGRFHRVRRANDQGW